MKVYSDKEYKHMTDEYEKVMYKCNNCGHKEVIPKWVNKKICGWCGFYIFKTKKDEDIYRIKEKIKNDKSNKKFI